MKPFKATKEGHPAFTSYYIDDQFPNASASFKRLNEAVGKPPGPKLECPAGPRPLATGEAQEGNDGRVLVRITSYRRRLLDEDNLASKAFTDLCRYSGWIQSDAPGETKIETRQVKVKSREEEGTLVEVIK